MSKKIKILYTIPNFDTAGSGKVLYDLAKELDKERFDVIIACSNDKGSFFKEVEALGLPIFIRPITIPIKPYFSFLFRLRKNVQFIKDNKIDIVHSWHWSSDWTEVLAARIGGAKFVYTKKAMTWGNIHWKIKSYLSNFIITINEEMKNYFPNKKAQKLIPLGLDTNYYSPEHFKTKQHEGEFKIITVANLVPVKGIEVLIDSVVALNNPNIKLVILGDDRSDYAVVLKRNVEDLNLNNRIEFLGKHTDVRPFIAQSDLYVIPTLNEGRKEGMPMALVEAMSMGVPVLGSDISGINYVLNDFRDYLFEASNSHKLTEKIDFFYKLSDSERNKIGNDLRCYVLKNFSMIDFINNHQKLYTKLIR
ncbi:glycosyltransferase [Flavobacterium sp.]|uniref:glycosyltransferase n=1 Tax=Flavobacterium sp. TaxID=239 RepID=UPI002637BC9D|nr:glycosyltransferase [Flavobacterium sp.]MDD3003989.1 glycosyltransferase [Flavobacterium sp.]